MGTWSPVIALSSQVIPGRRHRPPSRQSKAGNDLEFRSHHSKTYRKLKFNEFIKSIQLILNLPSWTSDLRTSLFTSCREHARILPMIATLSSTTSCSELSSPPTRILTVKLTKESSKE